MKSHPQGAVIAILNVALRSRRSKILSIRHFRSYSLFIDFAIGAMCGLDFNPRRYIHEEKGLFLENIIRNCLRRGGVVLNNINCRNGF